jgi:hypothetical protein
MLVQKFLSKHPLQFDGPLTSQLRDAEIRVHQTVLKEFEKFITEQHFTQKKLEIFENQLKTKIKDILRDTQGIKMSVAPSH